MDDNQVKQIKYFKIVPNKYKELQFDQNLRWITLNSKKCGLNLYQIEREIEAIEYHVNKLNGKTQQIKEQKKNINKKQVYRKYRRDVIPQYNDFQYNSQNQEINQDNKQTQPDQKETYQQNQQNSIEKIEPPQIKKLKLKNQIDKQLINKQPSQQKPEQKIESPQKIISEQNEIQLSQDQKQASNLERTECKKGRPKKRKRPFILYQIEKNQDNIWTKKQIESWSLYKILKEENGQKKLLTQNESKKEMKECPCCKQIVRRHICKHEICSKPCSRYQNEQRMREFYLKKKTTTVQNENESQKSIPESHSINVEIEEE